MQAAGLSGKVKIVGQGGDATTCQAVKNGQILAITPPEHYSYDYAILDALARKSAGLPVAPVQPNIWLVTKDNIPDSGSAQEFPTVADYKQEWAKFWASPATSTDSRKLVRAAGVSRPR
jgi:ABC-type sugar transport system substrate-binding protein